MKIGELIPSTISMEPFRRSHMRFVSEASGCYALTTFDEDILYLGLASNLRRRFAQHLDTPEKVTATELGRAIWFFWLECEDLEKIERTWMNTYTLRHGTLPTLNKVYSPISI
jgi:hypothetical protein